MTPEMLDRFRLRLEARKRELMALSQNAEEARRPVTLDQQSVGRVSRQDALQQQAMANAHEQRRLSEARRIDAALARIDAGDFGYCDACGEDIAVKRLEIDPTVLPCIDCA